MGAKTKIDWADATWNPVTGCLHGCEYCYARRIAERFRPMKIYDPECQCQRHLIARGMLTGTGKPLELDYPWEQKNKDGSITNAAYPFGFEPTFHRYKLDEPQKWRKPRNIFVCSMADLFGEWVPDEWILEVFQACEKAPQLRYLFLTKNPKRLKKLELEGKLPKQHWYGTSVTHADDAEFWSLNYNTFVSIEPMLESFSDENHQAYRQMVSQWVIFGAETGNRKNKIVPKKEWITELVDYYSKFGYTKFFMKESLRGLMGPDFRQEFPWEDEEKDG